MAPQVEPEDMTPEEYLAHYGVPGMKWGRRKPKDIGQLVPGQGRGYTQKSSRSRGAAQLAPGIRAIPNQKPTADQIRAARQRQKIRAGKIDQAQNGLAKTAAGKKMAQRIIARQVMESHESGDMEIARRFTNGEKTGLAIAGGVGAILLVRAIR